MSGRTLLRKAGFNEECMRVDAVKKKDSLRDIRLFHYLSALSVSDTVH